MIFLERLVADQVGDLDSLEITFTPRGRHLIEATPAAAATLRAALRCALFGNIEPGLGQREGALVAASIVAGGSSYGIERRITPDGRVTTALARGGPSGLVPIAGAERVERELDRLLGADHEALATLIWPPRDLAPLVGRLREIVRAWLGSRRMNVLAASVEVGQDLQEAERLASLHVALAQAAETYAATTADVQRLDYTRKRDRVARAVHQLEEADRLVAEAETEQLGMTALGERFERHLDHAERALALAHLLDDRDKAIARVAATGAKRSEDERRLVELSDLRSELTAREERLSALERGLAAYRRADEAATAADSARRANAAVGEEMAALERARQELSASRSKADRLKSEAQRAQTLSDRASEDSHLPTAHRLWREWLDLAPETEHDVETIKGKASALHEQLDALEAAVRRQARDAELRAGWRRLAAGGAVAGLSASVVGLAAFAPLTPLGLAVGLAGTLAGIWVTLADRGNAENRDQLVGKLDMVARDLQQTEHRMQTVERVKDAQARVERQLHTLDLEIPTSRARAAVLRDSASVRLRQMADGDNRRESAELRSAAGAASQAAEAAAREVRRLEARVASLNRRDPERQLIDSAAERRTQLQKAADARRAAERLAAELQIGASPDAIDKSRREALRELQQLRQRLSGGADPELRCQMAIRDQTRATDELAALDAEIARQCSADRPDATQRPRAVQFARLTVVAAQLGSERAHAAARSAALRRRTVQTASRRHTTDLAAALRALGIDANGDPTAAEARAAIPELDAEPVDAEKLRRLLRQARDTMRRTETRVQTLELRAGVAHTDIDPADAKARLDQAVRARRIREIGHTIVNGALDASIDGLPAAVERDLRLILPTASAGRFWDARIRDALSLEVWDTAVGAWRASGELDDPDREAVERARAMAFATAGPPLDASDLPAFLWLEQSAADHDGAIVQAMAAAAGVGAAAQRYPQVIVTGPSVAASLGRFDRVTRLNDGRANDMAQPAAGVLEAG